MEKRVEEAMQITFDIRPKHARVHVHSDQAVQLVDLSDHADGLAVKSLMVASVDPTDADMIFIPLTEEVRSSLRAIVRQWDMDEEAEAHDREEAAV